MANPRLAKLITGTLGGEQWVTNLDVVAKLAPKAKDKAFRKECGKGKPWMNKMRKSESNTEIEKVGRDLRKMMKWIQSKEIRK